MIKKIALILMIMIFVFIPCTGAAVTTSTDPMSAASPDLPDLFDKASNPNPYLTEYRTNYYLDSTAGMFNPVENIANGIANILFNLQQGLAYLLIIIFYYAFEFSFYDLFKDLINLFIGNMKTQFFDQTVIIILSLFGIFFFVKQLQRQMMQFWVSLIQTVLIVAVAIFYFTQPGLMLEKIDTGTKELSGMVLSGLNGSEGQTTKSVVTASNELWNIFVHRPWQYLEFGNNTLAGINTDSVLGLSPESKERTAIFKRLEDKGQWNNMGLKRVGFELMYLVPMLITFAILAALSGLVLMFQVLTMIIFLLGIFFFVIGLIPGIGPKLLGNWFQKLIVTAAAKVILVFFLSVIVAFNKALFGYADVKGWLITLLLQVIIYVAIFMKRNELLELFVNMQHVVQNPAQANRLLRAGEPAFLNSNSSKGIAGSRYNKDSYSKRFMRRDMDLEESDGFQYNKRASGEDSNESNESRDYYNEGQHIPSSMYPDRGLTRNYDTDKDYSESMGSGGSSNQNNNSLGHEMKQYLKKAEELLEKQIEVLRHDADVKAKVSNKSTQYDPRVKRADNREIMGLPKFDQKDITKKAMEIRMVERAGGKAEDLIQKSDVSEVKSNPKSVVDIMQRMKNSGQSGQVSEAEIGRRRNEEGFQYISNSLRKYEQTKQSPNEIRNIETRNNEIQNIENRNNGVRNLETNEIRNIENRNTNEIRNVETRNNEIRNVNETRNITENVKENKVINNELGSQPIGLREKKAGQPMGYERKKMRGEDN